MPLSRTSRAVRLVSCFTTMALVIGLVAGQDAVATRPGLGTAQSFAVLAGSTVANTGATHIAGDVGVSPGTAITGFPPGVVNAGSLHAADSAVDQAHADAASAYTSFSTQTPDQNVANELGGTTLTPGVYSSGILALTGTLTLDAQGDPNAIFVLQSQDTLDVASGGLVNLINGANDCNVYWSVATSATLGTNSGFTGTILADASITANSSAAVDGRLLANTGAVTLDTNAVTVPPCVPSTFISVSADPTPVPFGSAVTLTATVGPDSPAGVVTFTDANGTELGTATISAGSATLAGVVLPALGLNAVTASYGGDETHTAVVSQPFDVDVSAYAGELIVTEFRESGPAGAGDSYIELYNTGAPLPLAGFTLQTNSGTTTTLPAVTLGTRRSYLVAGTDFSLGAVATPDGATTVDESGEATLGTGGIKVTAPDRVGSATDAVGPAGGFHLGTGLAALGDTAGAENAWVRTEIAGAPRNTGSNAADFQLVSTTGAVFGGVQSTLGSPSPTGSADPYQHNAKMTSRLIDPGVGRTVDPNRLVTTIGPDRLLVVRRTITNTSDALITAAKVRITALSETDGAPQPGVATQPDTIARLQMLSLGSTDDVTLSSGATVTVHYLGLDAPVLPGGDLPVGGVNSTMTLPLPEGGLLPGDSVFVGFVFLVQSSGASWFSYDVDATETPVGCAQAARQTTPGTLRPAC